MINYGLACSGFTSENNLHGKVIINHSCHCVAHGNPLLQGTTAKRHQSLGGGQAWTRVRHSLRMAGQGNGVVDVPMPGQEASPAEEIGISWGQRHSCKGAGPGPVVLQEGSEGKHPPYGQCKQPWPVNSRPWQNQGVINTALNTADSVKENLEIISSRCQNPGNGCWELSVLLTASRQREWGGGDSQQVSSTLWSVEILSPSDVKVRWLGCFSYSTVNDFLAMQRDPTCHIEDS